MREITRYFHRRRPREGQHERRWLTLPAEIVGRVQLIHTDIWHESGGHYRWHVLSGEIRLIPSSRPLPPWTLVPPSRFVPSPIDDSQVRYIVAKQRQAESRKRLERLQLVGEHVAKGDAGLKKEHFKLINGALEVRTSRLDP